MGRCRCPVSAPRGWRRAECWFRRLTRLRNSSGQRLGDPKVIIRDDLLVLRQHVDDLRLVAVGLGRGDVGGDDCVGTDLGPRPIPVVHKRLHGDIAPIMIVVAVARGAILLAPDFVPRRQEAIRWRHTKAHSRRHPRFPTPATAPEARKDAGGHYTPASISAPLYRRVRLANQRTTDAYHVRRPRRGDRSYIPLAGSGGERPRQWALLSTLSIDHGAVCDRDYVNDQVEYQKETPALFPTRERE